MSVPACSRLRLKLVVLAVLALGAGLIPTAGPAHAVDTLVAAAGRASTAGKPLYESSASSHAPRD